MHDLPNCPMFTRHRSDRKEQGFWLVCPLVSSVRSLGSRLSSDISKVIALGKLLDFIEPQRPRLQTGTPTGHLCQERPHGPTQRLRLDGLASGRALRFLQRGPRGQREAGPCQGGEAAARHEARSSRAAGADSS